MHLFTCKVRCLKSGAERTQTLEAASPEVAVAKLLGENLLILSVERKRSRFASAPVLSATDEIVLTRQLAQLLRSGLTMISSLECLVEQTSKPHIAHALEKVAQNISAGASIGAAMSREFRRLSPELLALITVGEQAGRLPEVLAQYATTRDTIVRAKRRVISAVVYPCFLIVVCLTVLMFFAVKIIPSFSTVYDGLNIQLPRITELVLHGGQWLSFYLFYGLPGIAVSLAAALAVLLLPAAKTQTEALQLTLPIVGRIYKNYVMSSFSRTLSCLVSSGVPIVRALQLSRQCANSPRLQAALQATLRAVDNGETLASAFAKGGWYSPMFLRFAAVGEVSGSLDQMIASAADMFDEQIDIDLRTYIPLLEPCLIIAMGLVVGLIALALFLPMFRLSEIGTVGSSVL